MKANFTKKLLLVSLATTAFAGLSMPAFAQEADAADDGEIIVSARRRDETLQSTPVAITAALLELACELAAELPLMPCDISKAERGYALAQGLTHTPARARATSSFPLGLSINSTLCTSFFSFSFLSPQWDKQPPIISKLLCFRSVCVFFLSSSTLFLHISCLALLFLFCGEKTRGVRNSCLHKQQQQRILFFLTSVEIVRERENGREIERKILKTKNERPPHATKERERDGEKTSKLLLSSPLLFQTK